MRRVSDSANLVSGNVPILNVNITLINLRAILGSGLVTLTGDVELTAGDEIGLFYEADGLTLNLNIGGGALSPGIVWSMHKL